MSKLLAQEAVRTGIMMSMRLEGPILCPFFACCDSVVVFSADGAIETFPAGQAYGARAIYDVIAESGVDRLICGFIAEPCRDLLGARAIDIPLGSCPEAIATRAARSDTLPPAGMPEPDAPYLPAKVPPLFNADQRIGASGPYFWHQKLGLP